MSLLRPIHWYHSRADLIWPVSLFKGAQVLDFRSLGFHDFQPQSLLWVVDLGTQITFIFVLNFLGRKEPFNLLSVSWAIRRLPLLKLPVNSIRLSFSTFFNRQGESRPDPARLVSDSGTVVAPLLGSGNRGHSILSVLIEMSQLHFPFLIKFAIPFTP